MRVLVSPRPRLVLLFIAAVAACFGGRAQAQVDPLWDHYKVYEAAPRLPGPTIPVILRDQFFDAQHGVEYLEKFMNPVQKITSTGQVSPINDPLLHYTWWRISDYPFAASVTVTNQFGDQGLFVGAAVYLLNPALKNQTGGELPLKNHYRCYDCQGQSIDKPITMIDQFDTWQAVVRFPRYFCNPAEKEIPGAIYPIVDPAQHYVCYEFDPIDPYPFGALVRDQFIQHDLQLYPAHLICVPTVKMGVVSVKPSTWGSIKTLYR